MCVVSSVIVEFVQKKCFRLVLILTLLSVYIRKASEHRWQRDIHRGVEGFGCDLWGQYFCFWKCLFSRCVNWCHCFRFSCRPRAFIYSWLHYAKLPKFLMKNLLLKFWWWQMTYSIMLNRQHTWKNYVKWTGVFVRSFCCQFQSNIYPTVMNQMVIFESVKRGKC